MKNLTFSFRAPQNRKNGTLEEKNATETHREHKVDIFIWKTAIVKKMLFETLKFLPGKSRADTASESRVLLKSRVDI